MAAGLGARPLTRTTQYLAFPSLRFPLILGEAGAQHAERALGPRGAHVAFLLQAEMCRGMRWRFTLLAVARSAHNLPVKVPVLACSCNCFSSLKGFS